MNIMKWSLADGERLMVNLHASLDSIGKSRISQISTRCLFMGVHSTTFDPELRNERFNGKLACIIGQYRQK